MTGPTYGKPANGNSRALAVQQPAGALAPVLAATELDPRIAKVAKAIQVMNGANDDGTPKISSELAVAAAMYQAGTGQQLGRDFYLNEKLGRMEGYRGVARDAAERGIGDVEIKYRRLTQEELEDNEIKPADTTVACEVYQLEAWRKKQRLGERFEPMVGLGIIRELEKYTNTDEWKESSSGKRYKAGLKPRDQWRPILLEGGMTWHKKAKNRAYKDALRHTVGGHASAEEVLIDAANRVEGFEFPPDDARLTIEQAEVWVEKQERKAELAARTPAQVATDQAQQRARIAQNEAQGLYQDYRMSMQSCRFCGVGPELAIEQHANSCVLRVGFPAAPRLDDCEEGEFAPCDDEIPGSTPAATPTVAPVQPQAETIRQRLAAIATGPEPWKNGQADDKEAKYAEGAFSVLIRDHSLRDQVRTWLMGERANGRLTVGWARALRFWIDPTKIPDGDGFLWVPSEESVNELRTIIEATGFKPAQATLL